MKTLYYFLAALIALVSCSKDLSVTPTQNQPTSPIEDFSIPLDDAMDNLFRFLEQEKVPLTKGFSDLVEDTFSVKSQNISTRSNEAGDILYIVTRTTENS